jgi:hypothetical protein
VRRVCLVRPHWELFENPSELENSTEFPGGDAGPRVYSNYP